MASAEIGIIPAKVVFGLEEFSNHTHPTAREK
jgi:hypothetical protein